MSQNVYELIALAARYFFAALMVLIVLRAWRLTIVDSRRAQTLRRLSPETGLSGELIVMEGDQQARRGMRYPVIREGLIGSARRADIRIRHSSVRRRHAWFQFTAEGLCLRAHAGAPMRIAGRKAAPELVLSDGDVFDIGRVRLMLVLSVQAEEAREDAPRRMARSGEDGDALFDPDGGGDGRRPDPGQLFREHPLLTHVTEGVPEDEWNDDDDDAEDLFFDE